MEPKWSSKERGKIKKISYAYVHIKNTVNFFLPANNADGEKKSKMISVIRIE